MKTTWATPELLFGWLHLRMSCKARPEAPVQVAEERSDSRPVMDGSLKAEQDIAKCNRLARMSIDKADSQWVPGHIDAG